ncbi:MAG: hypothetical protein HOO86_14740 [Bacteroidales bacterium]|nr:hypothetical protein [Bacteroidales bacterium]
MENITSSVTLKNAIRNLQVEQEIYGQAMNEQLHLIYISFKPASLIRSTLKDVTSSPYLIENIVVTLLGLASGYVTKKIVVGASANIFRKLIGSVVQFGVTNIVAQHPEAVTSLGQSIFQKITRNKEKNAKSIEGFPSKKLLQ